MRTASVWRRGALIAVPALLLAACDTPEELDHPFYVAYVPDSIDRALYRCPDGPHQGCAVEDLPDPVLVAAGASPRYVVMARRPRLDDGGLGAIEYYYFARVPQETSGWGHNPERIVGPLTEAEFEAAKRERGLPEFSERWR